MFKFVFDVLLYGRCSTLFSASARTSQWILSIILEINPALCSSYDGVPQYLLSNSWHLLLTISLFLDKPKSYFHSSGCCLTQTHSVVMDARCSTVSSVSLAIHIHGITVYTGEIAVSWSGNKAARYKIIEEGQLKEKKRSTGRVKF